MLIWLILWEIMLQVCLLSKSELQTSRENERALKMIQALDGQQTTPDVIDRVHQSDGPEG